MLAVLFDTRYLEELVPEILARFDEKPVDWLVRQIKHDKGWNTPSMASAEKTCTLQLLMFSVLAKRSLFNSIGILTVLFLLNMDLCAAYVNHLGAQSTFKKDKRKRTVGSI